jgi:hypothetical protein
MSFKLLIASIVALSIISTVCANDTPKYVGIWNFDSEKTLASISASKDVQSKLTDVKKYGHMLLYPENFRIVFTAHAMGLIGSQGTQKGAQLADLEVLELDEDHLRFVVENLYTHETEELLLFFKGNCIYWPHKWNFNYYFCLENGNS